MGQSANEASTWPTLARRNSAVAVPPEVMKCASEGAIVHSTKIPAITQAVAGRRVYLGGTPAILIMGVLPREAPLRSYKRAERVHVPG